MDITLEELHELGNSVVCEENFVSFGLKLGKPVYLNYYINNFLHDHEQYEDKEIYDKRMKVFDGIESSYSIDTSGHLRWPEKFKGAACSLDINPLIASYYIEEGMKGRIGRGSIGLNSFDFHLTVSPQMARDIIEFPSLSQAVAHSMFTGPTSDNDWLHIRLDGMNFRKVGEKDDTIWFDVVRAYLQNHDTSQDED